jgi:predicted amidohydrolase
MGEDSSEETETAAEKRPENPRNIAIAGIMGRPVREGNFKDENFRETETLIREAAGAGAELVCTYEQFLDGYGFDANKITDMDDERVGRYEVIGESPYLKKLSGLAQELDIVIVGGVGIREATATYNSALIFDRSGALTGAYRKTHNQNRYARWFAPLTEDEKKANCPSFDVGPGRIGVKICNDRHFRETTEYMIENGCELLLCPSYGRYDPSRLVDDTRDFGLWAVFVHPQGCQFIHDGEIVYEQRAVEGKGSFALCEVEFRQPRVAGPDGR